MRVRWTNTAADDFARVVERIRADNPAAAHRVAQTIYRGIALLGTLPIAGAPAGQRIPESWCFLRGPISSCTKSLGIRFGCFAFATHRRTGHRRRNSFYRLSGSSTQGGVASI